MTPQDRQEELFGPLVKVMLAPNGKSLEELMSWDKKHWGRAEKLTMFPPWVSGYGLVRFALWEARRKASRHARATDMAELQAATNDLVTESARPHSKHLDTVLVV